jgi:ankyrin repeat protein
MNRRKTSLIGGAILVVLVCGSLVALRVHTRHLHPSLTDVAAVGDVEQVEAALSRTSDIDAMTNEHFGHTALMEAVRCRNVPVVTLLLQRGANPNVVCGYGATALELAISGYEGQGSLRIVRELLQHGADWRRRNIHGFSMLEYAKGTIPPTPELVTLIEEYAKPSLSSNSVPK